MFANVRCGLSKARGAISKSTRPRKATFSARPIAENLEGRALFSASVDAGGLTASAAVMAAASIAHPHIASVTPAAGATKVKTTDFVSAEVAIPNGGVNGASLTSSAIYLVRKSTGKHIEAIANTSGGGDVIVLKPCTPLAVGATYTFVITAAVTDVKGISFTPFQSSFTVGSSPTRDLPAVQFQQAPQSQSNGHQFFGLTMGPDGNLYAGTNKGEILRFAVAKDGSLGTPTTINTIRNANGGARFIIGLAFDPASTAENPILWVTHSATSALELGGDAGADWTGKVSRLSGKNLGVYHDAVVNLPRSVRDHVTDQCAFGPDGALYFCQPSQSSMGRADVIWGSRSEHLLSAAILRLDVKKLGEATLDARTSDGGGTYNPAAANAPLTIYATGVRNTFDLVWHSNGQLYAPGNGSAAGGNTPAGKGAPALTNVRHAETDYLFRIDKGGYYGHPNPLQGHFVLNGGNPTAGKDPYEVVEYPVGTQPDAQWKQAAFDMGEHESPDGVIEYRSGAFGGALKGKLLVCRYSGGDDIVALTVGADGSIIKQNTGMAGMSGLKDPVDLIEDPRTGCIYVSELGAQRITLLRPAGAMTPADVVDDQPPPVVIPSNDGQVPAPVTPADPQPTTDTGDVAHPPVQHTKPELKLIRKIDALCKRIGSATPATNAMDRAALKETLGIIKKLRNVARKLHQPAPAVADLSLSELRAMLAV